MWFILFALVDTIRLQNWAHEFCVLFILTNRQSAWTCHLCNPLPCTEHHICTLRRTSESEGETENEARRNGSINKCVMFMPPIIDLDSIRCTVQINVFWYNLHGFFVYWLAVVVAVVVVVAAVSFIQLLICVFLRGEHIRFTAHLYFYSKIVLNASAIGWWLTINSYYCLHYSRKSVIVSERNVIHKLYFVGVKKKMQRCNES